MPKNLKIFDVFGAKFFLESLFKILVINKCEIQLSSDPENFMQKY